jgi:thiol reductant ABC exporter CydD subunit
VWLAVSAGVGLGLTGCLVAQAVFLGDLLARLFRPPSGLAAVAPDLLGLGAAALTRSVLVTVGSTAGAAAANRVRGRLRRDALAAVLRRGPVWLSGERTGELAVTLGRGLDALDAYIGDYLPRLVLAGLTPLVLLAVIGSLDWLSLVILLVTLLVVPVFMVLIGRLTERRVARRWAALATLGSHFLDAVQGLATLRAYGRARRQQDQIDAVTDDLRRTTLAVLRETFLSALVLETLAAVGTALVAVPLALRLLDGRMTLAPALTVLILTPEVYLPLRRASAGFHAAAEGLSATGRVFGLLGTDPAAGTCRTAVTSGTGRSAAGTSRRGGGGGRLVVTDLQLSYPGSTRPALTGACLELMPGERVAIVGASGAGKSSLLAAIVGLVPATAGSITLDGLPQDQADPARWRERFSYLPQHPQLFSGSLADNIRLGQAAPPAARDDPRLAEALAVAQVAGLAGSLPGGLDAQLGEGGERLSAGERQRVALARALCRPDAAVVVLDEPTAHLDASTEARLVAALQQWLGGRSLLVASHRPRLLGLADRVITLTAGRTAPGAAARPPADWFPP